MSQIQKKQSRHLCIPLSPSLTRSNKLISLSVHSLPSESWPKLPFSAREKRTVTRLKEGHSSSFSTWHSLLLERLWLCLPLTHFHQVKYVYRLLCKSKANKRILIPRILYKQCKWSKLIMAKWTITCETALLNNTPPWISTTLHPNIMFVVQLLSTQKQPTVQYIHHAVCFTDFTASRFACVPLRTHKKQCKRLPLHTLQPVLLRLHM